MAGVRGVPLGFQMSDYVPRAIVSIEFPDSLRAVVTYKDGTSDMTTGLLALKWRRLVEALVHYERSFDKRDVFEVLRAAVEE
jgi:hypothetical protein